MVLLKTLLTAFVAVAVTVGAASPPTPLPVVESAPLNHSGEHWNWPLSPKPTVLRVFDPPDKPWLSGHRGVDLGSVSDDASVTAPAAGVVAFVGVVVDRSVITIDHGDGLRSSFEPVSSNLKRGEPVTKGQSLGVLAGVSAASGSAASGVGHCGSSPCLHWGVRRGEDYVNPLDFVQDMRPSILLPLA